MAAFYSDLGRFWPTRPKPGSPPTIPLADPSAPLGHAFRQYQVHDLKEGLHEDAKIYKVLLSTSILSCLILAKRAVLGPAVTPITVFPTLVFGFVTHRTWERIQDGDRKLARVLKPIEEKVGKPARLEAKQAS